jgi:hypothetical protein
MSMITRQTLFPHTKQGFARAASDTPVLLNGMRVLFDDKVALYPVELEPDSSGEEPERVNGKGRHGRR